MSIVSISNLSKTYADGFQALKNVDLEIRRGEILALLGPNGAGKTTLISIICGIVNASSGAVTVDGYDSVKDYRITRELIGLVPQELALGAFEKVWDSLCFSRGLFAKKPDPAYLEKVLKDLALWDKRKAILMELSGGMKRRVLIAKALVHEPRVLFLDEPTAGVDVELRKDMWALVEQLRQAGVTIILTTHYIEEAEAIADRVGVINRGELLLVDDKHALMHKLGKRQLEIELVSPVAALPASLADFSLEISRDGNILTYTYDPHKADTGIDKLMKTIATAGFTIKDMNTVKSSLEDIFVNLIKGNGEDAA
ncbi:ABC transporter ATP-binding protein [Candidatus Venteria ishoeyi]|uniref:Putative ABC transporter ATP-binding protein YbhF n=1 Tax=Candidatus Venteria ishoeyi TaxID=1899563 RepID=A0A1H6FH19_9GAMM|nr:ABC transporter ATP-binding protein [Candidatus Venteria ishoeyi]MDM8547666.1 ABC transporter ATP-binding protein [Candidatus Venteria ishoeyi]SEH08456.1 putative ABC transporter ATP-binding protein YbhF [Candidatus Venteria ishoeyi]